MLRGFALVLVLLQLSSVSLQRGDETPDIRYRFGPSSEATLNDQITREFKAMLMYEAMSSFFARPDQGLPGFQKYFRKAANEERDHAHKLMEYVNKRGGQVRLKSITAHGEYHWRSPLTAVRTAIKAELNITEQLYKLRDKADEEKDAHLVDYIESEFLTEQVTGIRELRELAAKLERVGPNVGEYLIDKEL